MYYVVLGYRHAVGKTQDGTSYDSYCVYFGSPVDNEHGKGLIFNQKKIIGFYVYLTPDEFKSLGIDVGRSYTFYYNDRGYIAKDSIKAVKL